MSPFLRQLLKSIVPRALLERRNRRIARELAEQQQLERTLHAQVGGRVMGGPFAGLVYTDLACGSMLGPKLLGVYERELAALCTEAVRNPYAHVVDIGAAEGYYAIGLLRACPQLRLTAFESAAHGREQMTRMARDNGVGERLAIHGTCDSAALRTALAPTERTLVICDIEGGEKTVLDPAAVPELARVDLLVEIHDFVDLAISRTLLQRFGVSHSIERIPSREHTLTELPQLAGFDARQMLQLASERRPCQMEWFWMQPKSH